MARGRRKTPPAVPDAFASSRPRRETPGLSLPPLPPLGTSRPAPPPSKPPLATLEAQLADIRGAAVASPAAPLGPTRELPRASPLSLARLPGLRRPGMASPSPQPRVGVARSQAPPASRGSGGILVVACLVAAVGGFWVFASRQDGRAWLDQASRSLGRAVPALAPYLPFRRTVEVTLVGVPRAARIRLDGTSIPNDAFEVPRDGALHLVEVHMRGMDVWRASFEARVDVRYEVILVEAGGADAFGGSFE